MNVFDMSYWTDGKFRADIARLEVRASELEASGSSARMTRAWISDLQNYAEANRRRTAGLPYRIPNLVRVGR